MTGPPSPGPTWVASADDLPGNLRPADAGRQFTDKTSLYVWNGYRYETRNLPR